MQWTQAQQQAIDARGGNLLVSAAAGSGKTAVLAQRILSLLQEGAHIDSLLVLTFTKAAAAEMSARIVTALHKAIDAGDAHLAAQAMRVERADITTLHSFCAEICRSHFQAAGVDPTFRVADGAQAAVLRAQALTEALTDCYERNDTLFQQAADRFSQESLMEAVETLHHFLMARPDPWAWLDDVIAMHNVTGEALLHSPWAEVLLGRVQLEAEAAVQAYERLESFACAHGLYADFAREEAKLAQDYLLAAREGIENVLALGALRFARRPRKTKEMDDTLVEAFAALRDQAKKMLQAAEKATAQFQDMALRAEDECGIGLVLHGLRECVLSFDDHFSRRKTEQNLLDFSDLEHRALRALDDCGIREAVRAKYAQVFVDEYQDSSLLQEALLTRVSSGANLFMVGDVKQSIYRFRLAEPSLFLRKLRTFHEEPNAKDRSILLNTNYRSHSCLLEAINAVFSCVFAGGLMEINYDAPTRLYPGIVSDWAGVPAELHLLQACAASDEEEDTAAADELTAGARESIRQEAEILADRILALQHAPEKSYRFRDMAVLMRTVRGKAAQVVEVLRARGVPAWSDIGEDALQRLEVQTIVALLHTIDNLNQDLPLLSALRGPALGLSDDALAAIRIAQPEGSMASAVTAYALREDDLAVALRGFLSRIRAWGLDAQVLPLDCLIRRLYNETGYYAEAGARPDGDSRQANLRMLAEHAGAYQRMQSGSLGGFLRYLERVRAHEGLAAQDLGEQDDVVRVLSIHKSKGLQFPIVFVAGLGRGFRRQASGQPLQMHTELGIGLPYADPALRTKRTTLSQTAIAEKRRQEALAEEARILYVAMTRAENRLILVGTPKPDEMERWQAQSVPAPQAKSMLWWVAPVAMRSASWTVQAHTRPRELSGASAHLQTKAPGEMLREWPMPDTEHPVSLSLSWRAEAFSRLPIKQSVSALVHAQAKAGEWESIPQDMQSLPRRPLFIESRGLTPSERGDAVHAFLRALPLDTQDLTQARRNMTEKGLLTADQADALPMDKLEAFARSALWARMRASSRLHRELPFNLRMDLEGRVTLLQGIIDCCFLEDGQWVLVDYKSDRGGEIGALSVRYAPQLALYADALARITAIPVRERVLYLLELETAVALP